MDLPLIAAIKGFFSGGNTLVQAGVIVLFFGVAFLLRYLAEHSHVSIAVRLSAVAVAGLALLLLGWRLRGRRPGYALALQGGGVGILYLTVFAALRLYALLPSGQAWRWASPPGASPATCCCREMLSRCLTCRCSIPWISDKRWC